MKSLRRVELRGKFSLGPDVASHVPMLSRQATAVDYDAAHRIADHSQEARFSQEDRPLTRSGRRAGAKRDYSDRESRDKTTQSGTIVHDDVDENRTRGDSQEPASDHQYGPSTKPPVSGQVCR